MRAFVAMTILFWCLINASPALATDPWKRIAGEATDIAIGGNGDPWIIGWTRYETEYYYKVPYVHKDGAWKVERCGHCVPNQLAVDDQGNAWYINYEYFLFRFDGTSFQRVTGPHKTGVVRDLKIGADGTKWIHTPATKPKSPPALWRSRGETWEEIPEPGRHVYAVDPKGMAWTIDDQLVPYRYDGAAFVRVPGLSFSRAPSGIAVGADGSVWIIGGKRDDKIDAIFFWNAETQTQTRVAGWGNRIALMPDGHPWIIRGAEIYRWDAPLPNSQSN